MIHRTHSSTHAHRIDKMSGEDKVIRKSLGSIFNKVIKKSANKKRRQYLKKLLNQ